MKTKLIALLMLVAGSLMAVTPEEAAEMRYFHLNKSQINFSIGGKPRCGIYDGRNLWITLGEGQDKVVKVDPITGVVLGTFVSGSQPTGIAFDGFHIWVVNQLSDNVVKMRVSDGVIVKTVPVPNHPHGICFDGENLWVGGYESNKVTKIQAATGIIKGVYSVGSTPVSLCTDGKYIYVANYNSDSVTKLLASNGSVAGTFAVGVQPYGICWDGSSLWVSHYNNNGAGTVRKLKPDGTLLATVNVGTGAAGLLYDGNGSVYVANQGASTISKIKCSSATVLATTATGANPFGLIFDGANVFSCNQEGASISKR